MIPFSTSEQNSSGHSVPETSVMAQHEQQYDQEIEAFQKSQAEAPKLSLATEARTIVENGSFGVLSTLSRGDVEGYPSGSVVEYATESTSGHLVFSFSSLSPHTGDVKQDPRCSFTVMAPQFKGLSDARVTVIGKMSRVPDEDIQAVAQLYAAKHPDSFWVQFGDFSWFRMDYIEKVRVVGGFARAGSVTGQEYLEAHPDPVAAFSAPVCSHMNDDHADATVAMVKYYAGITVKKATMLSLDSLGINVACERDGESFKCRLPFPADCRPVTERKAIKEAIVAMTRTAASP